MSLNDAVRLSTPRGRTHLLPVPARYRYAEIDRLELARIANRHLKEAIQLRNAQKRPVTFEPPRILDENAMWVSFMASSPELVAAGWIPGGMGCTVDKLDGPVWSAAEREDFA